jgi:hypothetical protein
MGKGSLTSLYYVDQVRPYWAPEVAVFLVFGVEFFVADGKSISTVRMRNYADDVVMLRKIKISGIPIN